MTIPKALTALGRAADVVTFEFENVPAASIERLAEAGALVAPGPTALRVSQDRVDEKTFLNAVGAPTVAFAVVDTLDDLVVGLTELGLPALLKTRREGYDGKGQVWIHAIEDAPAALESLGGRPAILEARATFVRELSVIAGRDWDGHMAVYPLGENRHEGGVLRTTLAPAAVDEKTQVRARAIAEAILDGLDYVGVIGVELFDLGDDVLLVNEIAPRVHNTGHWTQDGCVCDQFEQHIRAVAGWPLGPTTAHARHRNDQSAGRRGRSMARPVRQGRRTAAPLRQGRGSTGPQDGPCEPGVGDGLRPSVPLNASVSDPIRRLMP